MKVPFYLKDDIINMIVHKEVLLHDRGYVYEIIIPSTGTRNEEFRVDMHWPTGCRIVKHEFENGSLDDVRKVSAYGNTFLILNDFHHFTGRKNNQEDIQAHLSLYSKDICRKHKIGDNVSIYSSCAFYYRELKEDYTNDDQ